MKKIDFELKTTPIRREWKPSLAFKYRTTAEHKRRLHAFHRFKNYRERVGLPVRFYGDPLANDEINSLRREFAKEREPWLRMFNINALVTALGDIEGEG